VSRVERVLPGLAALADPRFRRLLAAQWTSLLGDAMLVAALPFAVFSLGGSTSQVGLAFGASAATLAALLLLGGVVADRCARRSVLVAADLVRAAAQGALALGLITGNAELWHLLAAQAVVGAGTAFALPALVGLVPETVPARDLQGANALRGVALSSSALAGPALAGVIVVVAGPGWAIALDALTFAIGAALVARLPRGRARARARTRVVAQLREGWGEFRTRRWLWAVVAQFAAVNALAIAPFHVLGATVARDSLGGAGAWALVLSATGAGAVAGAVAALAWRPRRPLLVATLGTAAWGAPLALLAAGAGVAWLVPAAFAAGTSISLFAALWETALQRHVPAARLARVSAYDALGSFAALPLGYALAGPLAALAGIGPALAGSAAVAVLAAAVVARLPDVRGLADPAAAAAPPPPAPAGAPAPAAPREREPVAGAVGA
jgi:hypothetical protein